MNCLIVNLSSDGFYRNTFFTCTILLGTLCTFVFTDFDFDEMDAHAIGSLVLGLTFWCILGLFLGYLSKAIMNEILNEAQNVYIERDSYKKLFDALQECILVVQKDKVTFMN